MQNGAMRCSAFSFTRHNLIQHSTFNIQHSTFSIQHSFMHERNVTHHQDFLHERLFAGTEMSVSA